MKTKRIVYLFCLMLGFMLSNQAHSQTLTLNGSVKDESGNPLPGVSIQVKGTSVGTATNGKGEFSIKADAGKTLIVSFIGYVNQEIAIKSAKSLDVVMKEDSKKLDEVVVVGYGTQKKANLTGSVATVGKEVLQNKANPNAIAALQGSMPGVTITRSNGAPGREGLDIQIRGVSSVNGAPVLVIVDGVPGSLSTLNSADIENISVLKDAAASAIYGSRAAGGVILVTTKNGKAGKVKVDYSGLYGFTTPGNMPRRIDSYQEAIMENLAAANAKQSVPYTPQQLEWIKDPSINYEVDPKDPNKWLYYDNVDWVKEGIKKWSGTQTHTLSVSGGAESTTYLLSLGYHTREGILEYGSDSYEKLNGRLNLNTKFNKYVSLATSLSYMNDKTLAPSYAIEGDYGVFYALYNLRGTTSLKDPNGGFNNPILQINEGGRSVKGNNIYGVTGNITVENIIPNLKFNIVASNNAEYEEGRTNYRTIIQLGNQGKPLTNINNPNSLSQSYYKQINQSLQAFATYSKVFGEDHNFTAIVGYAFEKEDRNSFSGSGKSMLNNDDFSFQFADDKTESVGESMISSALMSYYGRITIAIRISTSLRLIYVQMALRD